MKYIVLYLAAIVAANLLVARFGPAATIVDAFLFIALDLTARDNLHETWEHSGLWWKMSLLISAGSGLSYLLNAGAGRIALASFVAFTLANMADTLTYAALHGKARLLKVNGSNVVSALVDSIAFPTLAFGALLPWIVLGQFAAKVLGGFVWSVILNWRQARLVAAAGKVGR